MNKKSVLRSQNCNRIRLRWGLLGLLFLSIACVSTGCGTEATESEYSDALEVDRNPIEPLPQLSAEQIVWGPGLETDDLGRPTACLQLQEQYGSYNALFLDEEDEALWLTFDEGYENGYTAKILDVLKEKDVSAIFFITMDYASREPELIARMIAEGHALGNHTANHPNMTQLTLSEAREELLLLHDYVEQEFGYTMSYFRAPEGAISEQTLSLVQDMGYISMLWSFAYQDWDVNSQPEPAAALACLTERCHPGAVYLLHAVSRTNSEILGDWIDAVRAQGYTFRRIT